MNEHESNLLDLYAGFAMMAMVNKATKSAKPDEIANAAHDQAIAMMEERTKRRTKQEGGIADILSKWGEEK